MNIKQVLKIVVFNLIFVLLLMSVTYVIRTNGDIKDIFTGFYAQKKNTVDVVMIGSSPVYPYYAAPKIFGETGITAYPLSSNVQRPSAAIPLIKESLKTQKPKLYVFEMRMYTYEDGRMFENMAFARGVTDNMKYSLNRIMTINRMIPSAAEMKERMKLPENIDQPEDSYEERYTYYFDIFKYHSNWKTMILKDQYSSIFYSRKNPMEGFVIRDEIDPLSEEEVETNMLYAQRTKANKIPNEQEERLTELFDFLKKNDLQALFIVSPYQMEEGQMEMYNYLKEKIENNGYTFVNMNEKYDEIGIDFKTDFYDGGGHVNFLGARKCTEYLEKLLKEYNLEDHRNDDKYASYQQAYEYYLTKEDETLALMCGQGE